MYSNILSNYCKIASSFNANLLKVSKILLLQPFEITNNCKTKGENVDYDT